MSAQHTPGPWELHQLGDSIKRLCPADESGQSILTIVKEGHTNFAAVFEDADARLIAAAPELLDALKACDEAMSYMSEYDIPLTLPDQVKAAIAKATGEKHD